MEITADESDDEVVVVAIEAVTREPDVVRQVGVTVRASQHAVLADDFTLLFDAEPRERAGPPQRIPDGPGPCRIQRRPPGAPEQPLVEIGFEARGVRPPEHRELGVTRERGERLAIERLAQVRHEELRILAHRQHADAARVSEVPVEHGLESAGFESAHQRLRIEAPAEDVEL